MASHAMNLGELTPTEISPSVMMYSGRHKLSRVDAKHVDDATLFEFARIVAAQAC